jgi:DNA-binding response OmpR family regulator
MNKKLFIIEDDVNFLYSLQAKFSLEGFLVQTNTGLVPQEEILKEVKTFWPDFIILELALSMIDGFSVLGSIKSDGQTVNTPVFIFTSLDAPEVKDRVINLGAEYYFSKNNYIIDDFVKSVNKIIANREKIKR